MSDEISIVLASNRGPMSFVDTGSGFDIKRGAGGLAGALHPVATRLGSRAVWICAATSETDRKAVEAGAADGLEDQLGYHVYLLNVDADRYSRYYDVVSNRMLWFANHCLWSELDIDGFGAEEAAAWDQGYVPVNRTFADAVLEVAEPNGLVLIQDYHLALAPAYVRERRSDQTILHFTHSSFCFEGLRFLPEDVARSVLNGMLGADLVGFHTRGWAAEFLDACEWAGRSVDRSRATVQVDGRTVWVRSYPIHVDVAELRQRLTQEPAQAWIRRFKDHGDAKLIVRADRTEPSKNIVRGFEAFGALLDRRPDLVDRVRFIACLYPSRQSMPEYREYTDAIARAAEAVNARHPDAIELFLKDDFDRTLAALAIYDVLLVNSIMDGMNLVSKEGPTVNGNDGVVLLSATAGSFDELADDAVVIDDPLDVESTSKAMEVALELPADERRKRAEGLRRKIEGRSPEDWIGPQLEDLKAIRATGRPSSQ